MQERQKLFFSVIEKASEDDGFRAALLADPRSALSKEFDIRIPERINLVVHENDSSTMHLPLPAKPAVLSEGELQQISGGDCPDCGSSCI